MLFANINNQKAFKIFFFFNASILVELQLQCEEAETFLIQLSALQCKSEDSLILAATYSINMIVS